MARPLPGSRWTRLLGPQDGPAEVRREQEPQQEPPGLTLAGICGIAMVLAALIVVLTYVIEVNAR